VKKIIGVPALGRLLALVAAGAACVGGAAAASAHALAPALLELRVGVDGKVEGTFKQSRIRPRGERLEPRLPVDCGETAPRETRQDDTARWVNLSLDCGSASWAGRSLGVDGLRERGSNALVRLVRADGSVSQAILTADQPAFVVPVRASSGSVFRQYGRLGFAHLLSGWDHVLFLVTLLWLVPDRRLIGAITAFTVGHSATLALAALGFVHVPQGPVEVGIAASLLLLAVELDHRDEAPSFIRRRPWVVTGAFGLLHGLGFAGALAEVGLPEHEIPMALLAFNLGIEMGQLAVAAAAGVLAWALVRRVSRWPRVLRQVPVYAIGGMAGYWLFDRVAGLVWTGL